MENLLWYKSPAQDWNSALPIGNGRLGAMIWGKVGYGSNFRETIDLNEDTLWHGKYQDRNNSDSLKYLGKIRELLFDNRIHEAQDLARMAMSSTPKYFGAFEPLGSLIIEDHNDSEIKNYKRGLNLEDSCVKVEYDSQNVHYEREYFASNPDNMIVIRFKASERTLNFSCNLMRRPANEQTLALNDSTVIMNSCCGGDGVKFTAIIEGSSDGETSVIGDYIYFKNCSEAVIKLAAHSDFYGEQPLEACLRTLKNAKSFTYDELKARHIEDYCRLYNRVELNLGADKSSLPTDERLNRVKSGDEDNGLLELYYNFGRYIMISSSRKGTEPMNLQALWNNSYTPAWECNYTININTQMNYWPAEASNLSELHTPLFDLIERMLPHGQETAKKMYGCNGFVAHHCTNIWGDTAIEGNFFPSPIWPMGGAWLALHMMWHFDFTQNIEFLEQKAYPVLKQCAIFFHEYMVEDRDGFLVTGPSISPENTYITEDGTKGCLCMGPFMDMEIVTELFNSCIKCCVLLNKDLDLMLTLEEDLEKIRPLSINSYGGLMEWQKDYEEAEPGHRHMSHLYALFPSNQITYKTPELMQACRETINHRLSHGGGYVGWSCAWIANFYARLMDGDKCLDMLYKLLQKSTYINLFDVHPPFQVDGNMGGTSAIMQMLLQSHADTLQILPALPKRFKNGYVTGLKARGGFEVDIYWEDSKLKKCLIRSYAGMDTNIKLPYKMKVKINGLPVGEQENISLASERGKEYEIICS